jgi:hypothetical protein
MGFPLALANLETSVLQACASEEEWRAQVAAAICAGVDYAIAHPEVVNALDLDVRSAAGGLRQYESIVGRLTGFLRARAPQEDRLPGATDEALVAGMVGLVGDHLRIGRTDRLKELRPELVLLTLLPYLGFSQAQGWANRVA